jgi:membrane dipeptidase
VILYNYIIGIKLEGCEIMIFDIHADIWTDVNDKRELGENNIIRNYHLDRFRQGNVVGGVFAMWIRPNEADLYSKLIKMMKHAKSEIAESNDIMEIATNYSDITRILNENKIVSMISVEGLSPIGKNIDFIDELYDFGVRSISLTWNEENEFATGAKGNYNRGLTSLGKDAVKKIEDLGIILDVSHANDKTFWDIVDVATKPIVATHSNARALCSAPRNLTDDQIKAIAQSGGLIGINGYRHFIHNDSNKQDLHHLVDHIDYIANLVGVDHIAFGFDYSDYFGEDEVTLGLEDVSKSMNILNMLRQRGYSEENINKISHENFFKLIKNLL